ncbi:unnamed protein product [Brachionus calyciflorus]|uniref:Uncharacterized protein n=1 Tax=Brachionus calyciflorus TaxID=104777 RepID=A0A813ZEA2_9BILA|nr:unnamed protein product [Brachionus calyciflorus]
MNEISSSPSGITRITVNKSESFKKTPIERFKSKINLAPQRKPINNDVSIQVEERPERPLSFGIFRDDTILNTNLNMFENLKQKIDKISEALDLAKPKLVSDAQKSKPVLEKSKLIVVNLTPKPEIEDLLSSKDLNLPKKTNMLQTKINHETKHENQKKIFLNSTENHNFSGNILADGNNFMAKKNTSNRIDDLKLDDNQTPISTSFKSKSAVERSIDIMHDILLKNSEPPKTAESHNITRIEEINKKPNNNRSKSNLNEILKIKSLNYYDDIMTKQTEVMTELSKIVKHDDKGVQTFDYLKQNIETQTDQSVVLNINEHKNDTEIEIERDPFMLNKNAHEISNETEIQPKRLATFYNGRKSWTVVAEINETDKSREKEIIHEEEIEMVPVDTSDKIMLVESENFDRKKKKNLSVKIKLPDSVDSKEAMAEVVKKKRSAQKCCHLFFLLILFFVTIGILAYFFAWNFILDYARPQHSKNN